MHTRKTLVRTETTDLATQQQHGIERGQENRSSARQAQNSVQTLLSCLPSKQNNAALVDPKTKRHTSKQGKIPHTNKSKEKDSYVILMLELTDRI